MENTSTVGQIDKVFQQGTVEGICSPTENPEGALNVLSANGEVYTVIENEPALWFSTVGQPSSITFDSSGGILICDMAHQAIMTQSEQEQRMDITPLIKDYEGRSFLGPNSICLNEDAKCLYFTDSGPLGTTTMENPQGSVYEANLKTLKVKALVAGCLAHPCGIARTAQGDSIFVAETMANRVLRLTNIEGDGLQMSVFYQFSGRLGPTALAMNENGQLYVARYDFASCTTNGLISVINMDGEMINEVTLPNAPEITGLSFSSADPEIFYVTENSTGMCYRMSMPTETP